MPAVNVYGVRLGDRYKDPEGNILVVDEFVTPKTHTKEWLARAHIEDDDGVGVELPVKELMKWEKVS